MSEAKPILIVRVQLLTIEEHQRVSKEIRTTLRDEYNVLVISSNDYEKPEFEVLNLRDAKEVDIQELKDIIAKSLK